MEIKTNSRLEKILKSGQMAVTSECGPPRSSDAAGIIEKGELMPAWIKDIVTDLAQKDKTYGYVATQGILETRQFLAGKVIRSLHMMDFDTLPVFIQQELDGRLHHFPEEFSLGDRKDFKPWLSGKLRE